MWGQPIQFIDKQTILWDNLCRYGTEGTRKRITKMSSEWQRYKREREQREREAEENARFSAFFKEQQQRDIQRADERRAEERRRREEEEGLRSCQRLEQELPRTGLRQIAEDIQSEWRRKIHRFPAGISLSVVRRPLVELNGDGTVRSDRSMVGYNLSYSYKDKGKKLVDYDESGALYGDYDFKGITNLFFGLRYMTDLEIEGDKQGFRSQYRDFDSYYHALSRGVKGYFVGKIEGSDTSHYDWNLHGSGIPALYPNEKAAMDRFKDRLYAVERECSPDVVLRQARMRRRGRG